MKLNLLNVTSTEFDFDLVSHFTKHYLQYDIDEWHIILHRNKGPEPHAARKSYKALFPGIKFYEWEGTFLTSEKIKRFNEIISTLSGYVLLADIDELQMWPCEPKDMIGSKNIINGILMDRVPKDSNFKQVDPNINLFKQFPVTNYLSRNLSETYTHVPCIFHSSYRLISSHELQLNGEEVQYVDRDPLEVGHFRWTSSRKEKLSKRLEDYKQATEAGLKLNWKESQEVVEFLTTGSNDS